MSDTPAPPVININAGFLSRGSIANRVRELGTEIAKHYRVTEGRLLIIGLLKGSFIFLADLVRTIQVPHKVDFMIVSSYGTGTQSSGRVDLHYTPKGLQDYHVLVVADVLDSGTTLTRVCEVLREQRPRSLEACVLINKNTDAGRLTHPRFIGFNVTAPGFLVGYGMDYAEAHRHLPYVMRLK